MSLTKLQRVTVIAGHAAVTARAYSRTCPPPAPAPTPVPAATNSGNVSGCVSVPIYGLLPSIGPYGNLNGGYTYGIVGYKTVCYP